MQNALDTCKELQSEMKSTSWYSTFEKKVGAAANFAENQVEDVISELEDGISRVEELEGELDAATDLIAELKSRVDELERELDATVQAG